MAETFCGRLGPFVVKAFVASLDLCGQVGPVVVKTLCGLLGSTWICCGQDLVWSFGSPQLGCGCVPQGCCTGLFSAPKEFIVEGEPGPLWSSSSENKVRPLWR